MLKHFFALAIIIFVVSIVMLPRLMVAAEPSPNKEVSQPKDPSIEAVKENNKKRHDAANSYKISRERDNLSCLKPLTIKGLDSFDVVNKKGERVYVIKVVGFEGTCKWERDRLLFTKSTDAKYATTLVEQFAGNMYLKSSVRLIFSVEKLKDDSTIPIKTLRVPYFIALHDKKTDKIIWVKSLEIFLRLTKKPNDTTLGKMISFSLVVPEKEVLNKELLSGMYLQTKNNNSNNTKSK